jgi:hypothetical protein
VLIDAGDEATDSVVEDCRQLGSDASDFALPEPFDGYGLFRVYGEFIPRQNFETSDLPTYRLHKVVKLMDDCDIHLFLSKPTFFYSGKRLVSAKALLRLVTAKENYDWLKKSIHGDDPDGQIKRDNAAGEMMEAERAFIDASLEEWR